MGRGSSFPSKTYGLCHGRRLIKDSGGIILICVSREMRGSTLTPMKTEKLSEEGD